MGRSLLRQRSQSRVAILRPCTHPVWGRTTAQGSGQSVHPEGPQCPRFCPPHPSVWVARLGVPRTSLSWAGCRGLRRCLGTSAVQGPAVWGRAPPAPGVSPGPRRQQAAVCLRSPKPVACGLTGLPSRSLSPLWSGDGGAWGAGNGRVGGPALWGVDVEAGERGAGSSARAGLCWCRAPRTGRAGTVWSRP